MKGPRLMIQEEYREVGNFYRRLDSRLYSALSDIARHHESVWACPKRKTPDPAKLHRVLAEATSWEDMEKFLWRREEAKADEPFRRRMQDAFEECLWLRPSAERRRNGIAAIIEKNRPGRPHPPLTPEEYFDALDYFKKRDYEVYESLDDMASEFSAVWLRPEDPAASFETLHVLLGTLAGWDDIQRIFRRPPGGVMEDHELRYRVVVGLSRSKFGVKGIDRWLALRGYRRHMEALQARFEPQVQARVRAREAEARALQAKIKEWTREREARQDA